MTERAGGEDGISRRRVCSLRTIRSASVLVLLAVLFIVSSLVTDTFFTWENLVSNLLANAAYVGVIACGMTFVMVAGGFDLSVASTTAVCSVLAVLILKGLGGGGAWVAVPAAILGSMVAGTALGAANGALISYVGVNPFVVTLSTMLVFRGLALVITHGGMSIEVPLQLKPVFRELYWGHVPLFGSAHFGLPVPIIIFIAVFAVSQIVLRYTRFGHYAYAIGGNETASWLAGIPVPRIKILTYMICGLTCALAAIIYTGMSNTAQAASYQGLEMVVIASVIVGGTPLGGGSGGLWYTLNGILLLSVIENLLTQLGVAEEYRSIVRGSIILVVVAVDTAARRTANRAGARGRG